MGFADCERTGLGRSAFQHFRHAFLCLEAVGGSENAEEDAEKSFNRDFGQRRMAIRKTADGGYKSEWIQGSNSGQVAPPLEEAGGVLPAERGKLDMKTFYVDLSAENRGVARRHALAA